MIHYAEMMEVHIESALSFWAGMDEIELTLGDSQKEIKDYLLRNPGFSFVAFDAAGSQLIGTILCGHDGRRGFIYHLAVLEDYRNKGIAQELIHRASKKLAGVGIRRCMVMVRSTNTSAQNFWDKSEWSQRNDLMLYSINLA